MGKEISQFRLHNLLNDLTELAPLFLDQLRRADWLNAYLLAAGMNQIVEDYLHRDAFLLGKVARYLTEYDQPVSRFAARLVRWLGATIARIREYDPRTRRLLHWQADWAALVQALADVVADPTCINAISSAALLQSGEALVVQVKRFPPRLLREILHLPSCFRGFDQQPADLERIIREFTQRWTDRDKPLVVVGVRTSGSYLAPLLAAFLKVYDYRDVRVLTLRPERRLLQSERATLQTAIRQDGLVLLTDDPPVTGSSVYKSVKELERIGVPSHAIVLLFQSFGSRDTLPRSLQNYARVLLPWDEWHIHEPLTPRAVQSALTEFIGPAIPVSAVERLALPPRESARSHVHALYQVRMVDRSSGLQWDQRVFVQGVGLGYFGEYALAVADKLRKFLPHIYGLKAGLLYRAWLPEEDRLASVEPGQEKTFATAIATYIATRHQTLAVREDISPRLFGESPAWEVASDLLSRVYGSAYPFLRVLVVDPIIKHLLRVEHPSVVDGRMPLSHWFVGEASVQVSLRGAPLSGAKRSRRVATKQSRSQVGDCFAKNARNPCTARKGRCDTGLNGYVDEAGVGLLKVDFDEGTFSNAVELTCYDSVFEMASLIAHCDLAGSMPSSQVNELARHLRDAYAELVSEPVDVERWLLYELVHLWDIQNTDPQEVNRVRRASARALQRYFSQVFFQDLVSTEHRGSSPAALGASATGSTAALYPEPEICAIDIDGVLETSLLGFSGLTPAGAITLRALTLHGYRPILVTGRCLDEVRERCDAYRLAGGVAEYGACVYNRQTGRVVSLLSERDRADLDRVRAVLSKIDGVCLDGDYRYAVRAYRLDSTGRRQSLSKEMVASALTESGTHDRIRPIPGEAQTDFMVAGIDKGAGVRALADDLGGDIQTTNGKPLAVSVQVSLRGAILSERSEAKDATKQSWFQVGDCFAHLPWRAVPGKIARNPCTARKGRCDTGLSGHPLALAVGDTVSDLPMFELATLACAPANADARVKSAGVKVMRKPYQAGLALAATQLLSHAPGGCAICRVSKHSDETRLLLDLLSAPEVGKWRRLWDALLIGVRAKRLWKGE